MNYSVVGDNDVNSNCTHNLQTTLYGLQSSTVYQFTLSAIGPGGERVAPDTFVFQTKAIGMLTIPIGSAVSTYSVGISSTYIIVFSCYIWMCTC